MGYKMNVFRGYRIIVGTEKAMSETLASQKLYKRQKYKKNHNATHPFSSCGVSHVEVV